jgi:hypothetical protein
MLKLTSNIIVQQTRNIRIRKPPWMPRSKAKAFRVPPLKEQDSAEQAYITPIWREYKATMRSIYQLFRTELKFSDKASLKAQEEKRIQAEEEKKLLAWNNMLNEELLQVQLKDEADKLEARKKQLELDLIENLRIEREYIKLADANVKILKEKVKTFIDPNNLEFEIEKMLNERNDYNFAVNTSGQLFKNGNEVDKKQVFNTKNLIKEQENTNI